MNPVILAIGTAVPQYSYTQEQVFSYLKTRGLFKKIFTESKIKQRRFSMPVEKLLTSSVQELHESYQREAIRLSKEAINNCFTSTKMQPSSIDCIISVSCTGYTCPGLSHYIAKEIGLREDVVYNNILGMGCGAFALALRRAYDFLRLNNGNVLIVCVEICSSTYHPNSNNTGVVIGNAIFADGATAVIVFSGGKGIAPLDFVSISDTNDIDKLGYIWDNGRLKLLLSPKLPEIIAPYLVKVVDTLLNRNNLKRSAISSWVIHSGGVSILDKAKEVLGISEEKIKYSRLILSQYGNLSSPTILFILKELAINNTMKSQDKIIILTMGAGIEVDGILLEWRG